MGSDGVCRSSSSVYRHGGSVCMGGGLCRSSGDGGVCRGVCLLMVCV